MKKIWIVIFSVVFITSIGCHHKVDYTAYPTVSFSTNVRPILIANCSQESCHGTINPQSFQLVTYEDVAKHGGVEAGNPRGSELYQRIKTLNLNERMPIDPLPALSDEQIKIIYLWIGQGAQNN